MKLFVLLMVMVVSSLQGCGGSPKEDAANSGETPSGGEDSGADQVDDRPVLEITPGVGIGPVELGGTYGDLVAVYGEPDSMVDYYRIFFATWLELGVEVVVGSSRDDAPERESRIVSVGTRLPEGFSGVVIPGMSRSEADEVLGPCLDVIDDTHCYHSAGVYLGYDADGLIKTVAIHPPYTLRPDPPELEPALGLGGVK